MALRRFSPSRRASGWAGSRTLKRDGAAGVATVGTAGVEVAQQVLAETQGTVLPLLPRYALLPLGRSRMPENSLQPLSLKRMLTTVNRATRTCSKRGSEASDSAKKSADGASISAPSSFCCRKRGRPRRPTT